MPLCLVNKKHSPTFDSLIEHYKRKFPKIEEDVDEALEAISKDYRTARHSNSIPRFNNTAYKYRVKCSDMRRGAQGGYRLIAYYHQQTNTLFPVLIFPKTELEDTDFESISSAIKELQAILEPDAPK